MTKPYKGRFSEADAQVISVNYAKKDFIVKGLEFTVNSVFSQRNEVVNDTVRWNYNWFGEKALGLYGDPILSPTGAQQGARTIQHLDSKIFSTRGGLNYTLNDNHKFVFSSMLYTFGRNQFDELSPLESSFLPTRNLFKNVLSLAYELEAFDSKLRTNIFGKRYEQQTEQRDPGIITENGQNKYVEVISKNTTSFYGYGLATSYFIVPKVMASLSAEKAIRLPSENEIFGNPGENLTGNNSLKPEQSDNLNVGLRFGPYKIDNHKFTVGGSGFWRNSKDKIVRQFSNRLNEALQTSPAVNLGNAQSVGYEAALEYSYNSKLFVSMNMSKFNSLFKDKYDNNGNILPYYNQQLPNEPYFTVNGNVQYNFKNLIQKNTELNLYYNFGYVGEFYTTWLEIDKTTAQFLHDLGLSYTFPSKKIIVSFDAKNITDEQVYDNFAVQKPGRAFYLKLNYIINKF